jgi:hypothetical protein
MKNSYLYGSKDFPFTAMRSQFKVAIASQPRIRYKNIHNYYNCPTSPFTKLTDAQFIYETNSCSVSQKIPQILWNQKIYYHIHNNPPTDPYSEPNASSSHLPSYLFKIDFNIIFHLYLGL